MLQKPFALGTNAPSELPPAFSQKTVNGDGPSHPEPFSSTLDPDGPEEGKTVTVPAA